MTAQQHVDVLIVGAGLSGIGAACHLQRNSPNKSYAILEGRESFGGTWDLFKYPGIRSDSDMFTLGYSFKPWTAGKAIADGSTIMEYLQETIEEYNLAKKIEYSRHVKSANWDSSAAMWTVTVENKATGELLHYTSAFLFMCSGYYNYEKGYMPEFSGAEDFNGQLIHPQHWPEDLDYDGKKVVVIGSGATAVTVVPAMAEKAQHVTMLQRSPTYMAAMPTKDSIADKLRSWLPAKMAYGLVRWKNVLMGMFFYNYCRKNPEKAKQLLIDRVRQELPADFDIAKHFTPDYNPWDQRLCAVTDADLFTGLKDGSISMVTDHIDTFTETGIRLKSGEELEADIVVSATGLNMQAFSGMQISVDNKLMDVADSLTYKGMMLSNIPNFAFSVGYTNASWTLKCDLTCEYVCRLLNHMDAQNLDVCCPVDLDGNVELEPLMDFNSGYIQRGIDQFPKQGKDKPWKTNQNYAKDMVALGYGSLDDAAMSFSKLSATSAAVESVA